MAADRRRSDSISFSMCKPSRQRGRQRRHVRDEQHAYVQNDDDRQHRAEDGWHRSTKAIRRHVDVQPHRWRQIAQLHVRQEDDPELNGIDSVGVAERNEQRHLNDDCRVDIHQTADENQKDVQEQQKQQWRVHSVRRPFDGLRRNVLVDQVRGGQAVLWPANDDWNALPAYVKSHLYN